jgi:hypothetical protein
MSTFGDDGSATYIVTFVLVRIRARKLGRYWMLALAVFIHRNFEQIRAMVQYAHDNTMEESLSGKGVGFDFRCVLTCVSHTVHQVLAALLAHQF